MSVRIRAHYDGKAFVPDEPVDLPVGQGLELYVELPGEAEDDFARRRAALRRIASHGVRGTNIPLEALRRENLYEDRL